MNDSNYEDILNQTWDSIPEQKVLPVGSWRLKLRGASYKPGEGEVSPYFSFVYTVLEPMADVDADKLAELNKRADGSEVTYDFALNKIFHRIWMEDASTMTQVRNFLALHGVAVDPKKTLQQTFKDARGKEVVAYLGQREYTRKSDGSQAISNDPQSFAKIED